VIRRRCACESYDSRQCVKKRCGCKPLYHCLDCEHGCRCECHAGSIRDALIEALGEHPIEPCS
jgi:hypothetical protein